MIVQTRSGKRVKIQVKIPKIKLKKLTHRQIDEALNILVTDIQRNTPVDTGKLRASVSKRKTATGGEIYLKGKRNNEVAGYLIDGTKGHGPKKAKALRFVIMGRVVYTKWVKGIKKGYWKFQPSKSAVSKFANRIKHFITAK